MAEQALRQSGMPTGNGGVLDVDYYVPDFRIEVEGKHKFWGVVGAHKSNRALQITGMESTKGPADERPTFSRR